ncbi:ABC transporter substrate-binding protein [Heyndrickxia acidicola]|uniref:ABC transporter substrate-binding protein n=1 Tax=Heyndrickxia acidicola TaxID=209389 RepID=A0ABU6MDL7_9BACI|nr:ABC transporter substrate-binding protein [Heyndrickxia acidicola]MED1202766.1 ABC transporter substrate-binding protein [Heyndrickxia acidicola]
MPKKRFKMGLTTIAAISALGVALAGCGSQSTSTSASPANTANSKPVEGGNILLDTVSNFKDLDPALSYDTTSNEAVTEMYDQLITYDKNTTNLKPMLAESYTISKDGLTYTFKIRQGAKFWNGDPVTAQSFVDEFKRVLDPKVASPGEGFIDPIVKGSTEYNKGKSKTISGITTPDANTLVIQLTKPQPFFLDVLAMPFFSAVDQTYINKVGNKSFDSNTAMGSGPFKLASYDVSQMVLEKNKNYWMKDSHGNQLPYLDKITIRINKNGQLDALNYQQGKTAIIGNLFGSSGIPSASYPQFLTNPNLKKTVYSAAQNTVEYLGMNSKVAPFNNPKVRQAIEYAIDKKKILQLLNGRGQIANQPLPPGVPGYVKDLAADSQYSYNPQKAKQMLQEAGIKPGTSLTLYSYNDPDEMKISQSIQNDLNAVGFDTKVNAPDWNTFLTINEKGNTQGIYTLAWIEDFPDASDFLNTLFNSSEQPANNSSMYTNKQVDAWLNKAQNDTNQQERMDLYKQVTEQIMKDAPWVPMYYPVTTYAAQTWVHGFYISPVVPDPLQYIWIDKDKSQS